LLAPKVFGDAADHITADSIRFIRVIRGQIIFRVGVATVSGDAKIVLPNTRTCPRLRYEDSLASASNRRGFGSDI
jgi:hypothetical protein